MNQIQLNYTYSQIKHFLSEYLTNISGNETDADSRDVSKFIEAIRELDRIE